MRTGTQTSGDSARPPSGTVLAQRNSEHGGGLDGAGWSRTVSEPDHTGKPRSFLRLPQEA